MADYKEIAEMYRDEGIACIPVRSDKNPALPAGLDFLYKKIEIDDRYQSYGIAIACGKVSNGFEAIDFDKHGGQNIDSIFEQVAESEIMAHLISEGKVSVSKTPSGGYHIYVKSGFFKDSQVLARWGNDKSIMIEVRGNGSYIIVSPTPGYTHFMGTEILKLNECEKEERESLFNLCKSLTETEVKVKNKSKSLKNWGEKWDDSTPWGRFNKEEGETAKSILTGAGWQYVATRKRDTSDVELWRRPGKVKGISATFGMYENMFYCFSENADPFQAEKGYTPTDVLMLLKFDGKWKETRDFLERKYNITPQKNEPEVEIKKADFPIEVFPIWLQQYINNLNASLNYSKDFLSVSLMFTMATLNGNCNKLRVKNGWIAPTTFWFAVVGDPGTMKTHPISTIIDPLKKIDKSNKEMNDLDLQRWEAEEKKGRKPRFKQMIVMDYTLESIHDVHSYNPRGLGLYKDELIGFLNDMNKYRKGSDEQFWLESFNNKSYIVNRVTKDPLLIDNIMVNVIGTIQPDVLLNVASDSTNNGLIDRFLYTSAETEIHGLSMTDIDKKWLDEFKNDIIEFNNHLMYERTEDTRLYELTPDALKRMVEIDSEFCEIQKSEDETSGIRNYVNKLKTYLPRFALLMALMELFYDGAVIGEVNIMHMDKAKSLCDYFLQSARFVFDQAERTSEINNVKRSMQMQGLTKAEQILKLHQKGFKNVDISKQLKTPASYVSKILNAT